MPKKKIAGHPAAHYGAELYATLCEAAIYAAAGSPAAAKQLGVQYARDLARAIDGVIAAPGIPAPDGGRPQVVLTPNTTGLAAEVAIRCGIDPALLPTMARVIVTGHGVVLETNGWTAPSRVKSVRVFDTLDAVIARAATPLPVSGGRLR